MDPTILATIIGGAVGLVISLILTLILNVFQRRRHTKFINDWNAEQAARYQRGIL